MASIAKYGDSKFNLAAQGHRQAGSTFKVMVLMTALRRGVEPDRHELHLAAAELHRPALRQDRRQHVLEHATSARVNLVKATLASDNTVYQQLDLDLGPEAVTETARDMGITSELHAYPAEGLGGLTNGVSPLEMANAYATIASGGVRNRADRDPQGHVPRRARRPLLRQAEAQARSSRTA